MRESIKLQETKIESIEESLNNFDSRILEQEELLHNLSKNAALMEKTDDLENMSRRNNVRVYGVPERIEGNNITNFMTNWIPYCVKLTRSFLFCNRESSQIFG